MSIPSFAHFILYFSRALDLQDAYGGGGRGLALSSGVGWSLGLAYGLIYIVFVKRYLLSGVNMKSTFIGILLLMGTIFAGRTGFCTVIYWLGKRVCRRRLHGVGRSGGGAGRKKYNDSFHDCTDSGRECD